MSLVMRVEALERQMKELLQYVGVTHTDVEEEDEDEQPKPTKLFKVRCDNKAKNAIPTLWLFGSDMDEEWSWSTNIEGGRAFDYRSACVLVDSEGQQPKGYGPPYIVRLDGSPIEDDGE